MKWYRVMAYRNGEKYTAGYYKAKNGNHAIAEAAHDYALSAAGRECNDVETYEWKAIVC